MRPIDFSTKPSNFEHLTRFLLGHKRTKQARWKAKFLAWKKRRTEQEKNSPPQST